MRAIEKTLGKGLMHYGVVDYERRYPAKELSDIYQELQNRRMQQEHLLRTLREKPSLEEKIQFSSFCSEYVGIYDDISRQWQVLPYEVPIYELISKQVDFAELEEGQKCSIFKQVNGVFYANNRILNDIANGKLPAVPFEQELAEEISQGMIQWYNDKLLYKEFEFKDRSLTEGKFVNNIAQYYDAHKKYEIGYRYRLEAIKYKTGDFLIQLLKFIPISFERNIEVDCYGVSPSIAGSQFSKASNYLQEIKGVVNAIQYVASLFL